MQLARVMQKVGALSSGALMLGATLAGAVSLVDFPSPFVDEGEIMTQIVVGESAATSDVVGAIQIGAALGNAAFKTETVTRTATGVGLPGWNVDGDGKLLSTSNDQLFFGSNINVERDTLSEGDLGILSTTTFEDDDGNTVDVDFDILVGQSQIKFTNDVGDLDDEDPQLLIDIPDKSITNVNTATEWLYKVRITFDEPINFSSSAVQTQKINILGQEYTISTDSMSDPGNSVVLFGGEQVFTIGKGESFTFVDENGDEHTVEVVAVTDSDTVAYKLDGVLDSDDEGDTVTVPGTDTEILIDTVVQTNSDLNEGSVTFKVGRGKIILQDGQEVKIGASEEDVDGTLVKLEGTLTDGTVTGIVVAVAAKETNKDYLLAGQDFIDPVFGTFKVVFGGLNPALDSEERETIEISPSGDDTITVSFTTDKGDEVTFEWAHTEATDITSTTAINLADGDADSIVVVEGAQAEEDDYIIADAEFSHIFEVDEIDVDGDTDDDEVVLRDIATGKKITFDNFVYNKTAGAVPGLGNTNNGVSSTIDFAVAEEVIDGKNYRIIAYGTDATVGADAVRLGWGAGVGEKEDIADEPTFIQIYEKLTGANQTDGRVTLFPAVDTQHGAGIAFVPYVSTVNHEAGDTVVYELPSTESSDDKTVTITLDSNTSLDRAKVTGADSGGASSFATAPITFVKGAFQYNITGIDTSANTFNITVAPLSTLTAATPALLFIEEEDDDDKESGVVVYPGRDVTDDELTIGTAANINYFKQGATSDAGAPHGFDTLESDDDLRQRVTLYGTLVEVNTDEQGHVKILYPDEQAVAGVAFTALDGDLVAGGAGTVTVSVDTAVPSGVPDLSMLDSEVTQSTRSNFNLILVGGPAINSLVRELSEVPDSGVWDIDTWRDGAHDNRAQIVLVEDAFASGKAALVVAGHSAPDTRAASKVVANWDKPPFTTKILENNMAIEITSAEYPA